MRGTVKAYSVDVNAGVIDGDDGRTYGFDKSEWAGEVIPLAKAVVLFDGAKRRAKRVSEE